MIVLDDKYILWIKICMAWLNPKVYILENTKKYNPKRLKELEIYNNST